MAEVSLDALYPRPCRALFVVTDAFMGLTDDPTDRVAPKHDSLTLRQMTRVKPGERCAEHYSRLRLSFNKPTPTVNRGGGAGEWHIWHPAENRPITRREVKRLASFPDSFRFAGSISNAFTRIGNSVPPLFMRSIARHIDCVILESCRNV